MNRTVINIRLGQRGIDLSSMFMLASMLLLVVSPSVSNCLAQEAETAEKSGTQRESSPEALAIYSDAASYQKNNAFELAAEEWQKFLKDHGDDPKATEARYNLGTCFYQLATSGNDPAKLEEAVSLLREAIAKRDDLERPEDAYFNLGSAIYSQALKDQPEKFAEADKAFTDLLQEFPDGNYRDQALFFRGESLYLQNKRAEAEAIYAELVEKHGESPILSNGLYALGVTREELGKFKEAGEVYKQFQEKFKDHKLVTEVRMREAETILQLGNAKAAEEQFAEVAAVENFDRADNAIFRQAYSVALQNRFEDSAKLFKKVVDDFPDSQYAAEAKMAAARSFFRADKGEDADGLFEEISGSKSIFAAEAAHWRARLKLKQKDPDTALQIVDQALPKAETSPFYVNLQLDRADAFFEIPERKQQSIGMYEKLYDDNQNHPLAAQSLYNAAYGAMMMKDYENGLRIAKKFLSKYTRGRLLPDVKNIAGECALQLGKNEEAEKFFADLAKTDDANANGGNLASWQIRQGLTKYVKEDYNGAIQHLEGVYPKLDTNDAKAEAMFLIGMSQFNLNQFEKAQTSLQESLSSNPKWRQADEAMLNLSRSQRKLDNYDEAIVTVDKMIADYPESKLRDRAFFHKAEYNYAKGDFEKASESYAKVLDDWPESSLVPFSLYGKGWSHLRQTQYPEASEFFGKLLEEHQDHRLSNQTRYARAMCRQQMGDFKGGLKDVEQYMEKKPEGKDRADALYVKGLCEVGTKDFENATKTFKTILDEAPDYSGTDKVMYELAWALKSTKKDDEAQSIFQKLANDRPNSQLAAEANYHIGEAAYNAKEYASAIEAYQKALKNAATRSLQEKAIYKLAWSSYQSKNYEDSFKAFEQQVKDFPEGQFIGDARFMKAECLFKNEEYDKALTAFTDARKAGGTNKDMTMLMLLHAGQAASQSKKWKESIQWLDQLEQEYPKTRYKSQADYERGWAYQNLEQVGKSITLYKRAAEASRSEVGARARFMLGEAYFSKRDFSNAIREFQRVMYGYGGDAAPETVKRWQSKAAMEAGRCAGVLAGQQPDAQRRAQYVSAAKRFYGYVATKHPRSQEAKAATEQLRKF